MNHSEMSNIQRVSPIALTEFAWDVIRSLGASEDRSRTTANVLVAADLRGISSHGVAGGTGFTELVERTRAGAINIEAVPEIQNKPGRAVASMNAKGGLGPSAAMEAAHLAGDLAEQYGVGRVHVYDTNHFGAACEYVESLLKRGLAARCTSTSGAWMIPYGGNRVRLGTTPIAWGIPYGDEAIVIDMATTQRSVSPAFRAAKAGDPIPRGPRDAASRRARGASESRFRKIWNPLRKFSMGNASFPFRENRNHPAAADHKMTDRELLSLPSG